MDFGKAFTFVFDDPDWIKKVGIAALLLLIPILGTLMLGGWAFHLTRNVIRREENPMPDWSDFGDILVKGLQVFVIGFAYALPIILISACGGGAIALFQDGSDETLMSVLSIVNICISCFSMIYGILLAVLVPAALGNFAAKDDFGAAFRFSEVFGLVRTAPGPYLLVLLGGMVAGLISMLGLIVCIIGVFFTAAYAMAVNGHLYGQAYNAARALEGTPSAGTL